MVGGAWPIVVGGAICLVNSDNERDSSLLNRCRVFTSPRKGRVECVVVGILGCGGRLGCGGNFVVWAAVIVHPVYAHFASGIFLLRGTSGVQPRDSEQ